MDASLLSQKYFNKYKLKIQQINTSIFNNLVFNQKVAAAKQAGIVDLVIDPGAPSNMDPRANLVYLWIC